MEVDFGQNYSTTTTGGMSLKIGSHINLPILNLYLQYLINKSQTVCSMSV